MRKGIRTQEHSMNNRKNYPNNNTIEKVGTDTNVRRAYIVNRIVNSQEASAKRPRHLSHGKVHKLCLRASAAWPFPLHLSLSLGSN